MMNKTIHQHHHNHELSDSEMHEAYKIFFGTLCSESRLKIINLLRAGRKNVSEIMSEMKMDQTAVSHDLSRLKKCGFVKSQVEGKYRYYSINEATIKPVMSLIDKHMKSYCIHILHGMKGGSHNGK